MDHIAIAILEQFCEWTDSGVTLSHMRAEYYLSERSTGQDGVKFEMIPKKW